LLFRILAEDRDSIPISSFKNIMKKHGMVELEEHEKLLLKLKQKFTKNKQTFKTLFKDIDYDNSGTLNREEFRTFLRTHNDKITDHDIDDMLKYMNIYSNYSINYNDFITQLNMLVITTSSSFESVTLKDWISEQMIGLYNFFNKSGG